VLVVDAGFTLGEHRIVDLRRRHSGVIVPSSNTNAEPDCLMLAASGSTLHVSRSGGYGVEAIPASAEMRRFARQALDQQLQLLVDTCLRAGTSCGCHGLAFRYNQAKIRNHK
jgi:maleate cis-trans isomerase